MNSAFHASFLTGQQDVMYIGLEIPPSIRTVTSPYKAEQTTDKPVVVFF